MSKRVLINDETIKTKKHKSLTKLIISQCMLYLIGNIPGAIYFTVALFTRNHGHNLIIFNIITQFILFSSYGFDIVLYIIYNEKYRTCFKNLFKFY